MIKSVYSSINTELKGLPRYWSHGSKFTLTAKCCGFSLWANILKTLKMVIPGSLTSMHHLHTRIQFDLSSIDVQPINQLQWTRSQRKFGNLHGQLLNFQGTGKDKNSWVIWNGKYGNIFPYKWRYWLQQRLADKLIPIFFHKYNKQRIIVKIHFSYQHTK